MHSVNVSGLILCSFPSCTAPTWMGKLRHIAAKELLKVWCHAGSRARLGSRGAPSSLLPLPRLPCPLWLMWKMSPPEGWRTPTLGACMSHAGRAMSCEVGAGHLPGKAGLKPQKPFPCSLEPLSPCQERLLCACRALPRLDLLPHVLTMELLLAHPLAGSHRGLLA